MKKSVTNLFAHAQVKSGGYYCLQNYTSFTTCLFLADVDLKCNHTGIILKHNTFVFTIHLLLPFKNKMRSARTKGKVHALVTFTSLFQIGT